MAIGYDSAVCCWSSCYI